MRLFAYFKNNFVYQKNNSLYITNSTEDHSHHSLIFKRNKLSDILIPNLLERLLRKETHNVLPISTHRYVVVIKHYILTLENGKIIHEHRINFGSRPIQRGICVLPDNSIIYGDYWSNPDRIPVNLYISRDEGKSWQTLWTSKKEFARHIHFVKPVKNEDRKIYFGTGDYNHEPGIYKMNIDTKKVTPIGEGNQKLRAVDIIQKDNQLIWGTDCEYDQNFIYSYHLNTKQITKLAPIDGPAYYTAVNKKGDMFIGTTIEDRKKHRACIYQSTDGIGWKIYKEFKKDIWSTKYFGYGVIEFIHGQENLNKLYYNLKGLKEIK